MTKKDYIKLAEAIKGSTMTYDEGDTRTDKLISKDNLLYEICWILEDDNPKFDRERFITACQ